MLREKEIERFWNYVDRKGPDECWEWRAYRNKKGYGRFATGPFAKRKNWQTHRLVYLLTHGNLPDGLCVLHHCDNPPCCNPAHLYAGTFQDNMDDRQRRHRTPRGEDAARAKLTWALVEELREQYKVRIVGVRPHWNGVIRELSREYGIHYYTLYDIIKNKTWNPHGTPAIVH